MVELNGIINSESQPRVLESQNSMTFPVEYSHHDDKFRSTFAFQQHWTKLLQVNPFKFAGLHTSNLDMYSAHFRLRLVKTFVISETCRKKEFEIQSESVLKKVFCELNAAVVDEATKILVRHEETHHSQKIFYRIVLA